ncbi:GNAT family N-acetyltransferase [Cryobacterium sp. Hh38]|uniref:GNAT family N-acetyltransferase n=1 Tax=Cryobacterium sp. Hh38 TaxID=1259156 RepID=UPI003511B28C
MGTSAPGSLLHGRRSAGRGRKCSCSAQPRRGSATRDSRRGRPGRGSDHVQRDHLWGISVVHHGLLGYWVAEENNGRGYATDAVRAMTTRAFEELGLHRVQAETLIPNVRSQRVLQRVGFVRYGLAPAYLKIAGRWQDHLMYQLLADPR